MNEFHTYAYALGYFDGRANGYETVDTLQDFSDAERNAYRRGYDRGVTDYCDFDAEARA